MTAVRNVFMTLLNFTRLPERVFLDNAPSCMLLFNQVYCLSLYAAVLSELLNLLGLGRYM